jgi:hypothetical protein
VRVEKETTFMDTWPDQAAQDLGWIYVPFGADGLSEAVTVVVSGPEQAPRIRSVAWGRP